MTPTTSTSHFIWMLFHLWNYEITGISQNPSVQIIKVRCRCLQFYITEMVCAIKSTIIPAFQPLKKEKSKSDRWSACARADHRKYILVLDIVDQVSFLRTLIFSVKQIILSAKNAKATKKQVPSCLLPELLRHLEEMEAHIVNTHRVNIDEDTLEQLKYTLNK